MEISLAVIFLVSAVTAYVTPESAHGPCPKNLVSHAQTCFSDLDRAVHAGSRLGAETGAAGMTLDYSKIKDYCAKNGHVMSQFVACIERLVTPCRHSPQAQLLDRLVSPERVKDAVPTLCAHRDEVEAASTCINSAMTLESECTTLTYAKIKATMAASARNTTAMFLTQCAFFHSLAECQRGTVSEKCGSEFGDLHANFLLSFVPTSCIEGVSPVTSHNTANLNANVTSQSRTADTKNRIKTADSKRIPVTPEKMKINRN